VKKFPATLVFGCSAEAASGGRQNYRHRHVVINGVAQVKRLKTGRWRIYRGPAESLVRDPATGTIATFESLADARRWWSGLKTSEPLQEAHKCARCGAYFGASTPWTVHAGRPYHLAHAPGRLEHPDR